MKASSSILRNPNVLVRIQQRLYHRFQPLLNISVKRNEPEWLRLRRSRAQHLYRSEHRPRAGEEHQADARTLIQGLWHIEQAPSKRNDLKFAALAPPVG